jgi:hypothetical protein
MHSKKNVLVRQSGYIVNTSGCIRAGAEGSRASWCMGTKFESKLRARGPNAPRIGSGETLKFRPMHASSCTYMETGSIMAYIMLFNKYHGSHAISLCTTGALS